MQPEEIQKSLQQIVATAIKHSALQVSIDLDRPSTTAVFSFEAHENTSVDVSLPPEIIAGALISRTQFREWREDLIRGIARIDFKSLSVDCEVIVCRHPRRVIFSRFLVDTSENPAFWLSLSDPKALRRVLGEEHGVLIVASAQNSARNLALRAVRDSFPDIEVVPLVEKLTPDHGIFERAKGNFIVIGVDAPDVFDVLSRLESFPERDHFRGIFSFAQVPRNCVFCREHYQPETIFKQLPQGTTFQQGKGCGVCETSGVSGFIGVTSLLLAEGEGGRLWRSGAGVSEIARALGQLGFQTLFSNALREIRRGEISVESVLRTIAGPPVAYLNVLPKPVEGTDDGVEPLPLSEDYFGSPVDARSNAPDEQPLRGKSVYTGRKGEIPEPRVPRKERTKKMLLVIDDDPDQRAILSRVFELAGYDVETAADGIDGIVSATKLKPDLIVVDFMMPDVDGRETVSRLRKADEIDKIPVICLTAYADSEVEYKMLDAGVDDFCSKSVSKKVLLKRVERLLHPRREA